MEHFYQTVRGWFGFPELYKKVVQDFPNGKFVEVGSWLGQSAVFMAVEIINSNNNIKFYCVDTWQGSEEHQSEFKNIISSDSLFKEFLKNIEPVKNFITPIRKKSEFAALDFEDSSLDFVFIDASHDYENVKKDLESWYCKIKSGGVFAGHDYNPHWKGLIAAVNEFADKEKLKLDFIDDCCWMINKP